MGFICINRMRAFIYGPFIALLSSLTTLKVQELRREEELKKHQEDAATQVEMAAVAGESAEAEIVRLKTSLTAAIAKNSDAQQQLTALEASLAKSSETCTEPAARGAAAATEPAKLVKTDPLMDVVNAYNSMTALVLDVILYAGGRDDQGRQRLESPIGHISNLTSEIKTWMSIVVAGGQTRFPELFKGAQKAFDFAAMQGVRLYELAEASINRFVESNPQHRALLSHEPVLLVGGSLLALFFLALDLYIVCSWCIWCAAVLLACCSMRSKAAGRGAAPARAVAAAVRGAQTASPAVAAPAAAPGSPVRSPGRAAEAPAAAAEEPSAAGAERPISPTTAGKKKKPKKKKEATAEATAEMEEDEKMDRSDSGDN